MKNKPVVMGIINLSPNSFHNAFDVDTALKKAEQMVEQGATYLDVGALATNPNVVLATDLLTEQQELDLVVPFVERLSKTIAAIISVDTFRPGVMRESVRAGAKMINDQRALTEPDAIRAAIDADVPICLMHHFLYKRDLENPPLLPDFFSILLEEMKAMTTRCLLAGIKKENIVIDPGFGGGHYAKSVDENFYILSHLSAIVALGFPVLVGLSRKSFFGALLDKPISERLSASLAGALLAMQQGAAIVRVHDVAETMDVLRVFLRCKGVC